MRVAEKIELDAVTERELRVLSKRRRVEARLQQRARVILLAARGLQNKDIAVEVALDRRQVALWRQRFLEGGIDALRQDAPRSGRTPTVTAEMQSQILEVTLHSKPAAATHWSTRTLAEHLGLGATTIRRVWQRNGIKPHLARTGVSEFLCVRLGRLVHGGGRRLRRTTDAVGKSVPHITRQPS